MEVESKSESKITLSNLWPDTLEAFFEIQQRSDVSFDVSMPSLSRIDEDVLPDNITISTFLRRYFNGEKNLIANGTPIEFEGQSFLAELDLKYRLSGHALAQAWILNRIGSLIHSRRAFVIASKMKFHEVVDCFVEAHSVEWFGPLKSYLPFEQRQRLDFSRLTISADRSAKVLGENYFIHAGTNHWNRAWLPSVQWSESWEIQLRNWTGLFRKIEKLGQALSVKKTLHLFIPEKDAIARTLSPGYFQSGNLPLLLMMEYFQRLPQDSILFPLLELAMRVDPTQRLTLPDSHLSGMDYWEIFQLIVDKFGHSDATRVDVGYTHVANFSDLGSKFGIKNPQRQIILFPIPEAEIVAGQKELKLPLRENHIALYNKKAPIKASLLILGDSHSSTYSNPFLTFISSHFFQKVEFLWNPFLVHELDISGLHFQKYDYLLTEISQRFATPAIAPKVEG